MYIPGTTEPVTDHCLLVSVPPSIPYFSLPNPGSLLTGSHICQNPSLINCVSLYFPTLTRRTGYVQIVFLKLVTEAHNLVFAIHVMQ